MIFRAEVIGRDWVEIEVPDAAFGAVPMVRASGCLSFLRKVDTLRGELRKAGSIRNLNLAAASTTPDHTDLLLKEVILKAQGRWDPPYKELELCHCRAIPTAVVDQSIVGFGARTPETVTRLTSAGSACGTCRGDTIDLIRYRLS